MYSVVGCSACRALWIVEGRPETTNCPRCEKRHQFERLKQFTQTDSSEAAARVRSAMLAKRADDGEFVDPEEIDIEGVGMSDEEFLTAAGLDAEAVSDAERRTEQRADSRSRKQVVLDALVDLEEPTDDAIVEYADAAGVPESYVERTLRKLRRAGEVTETGGVYRKL